MDDKCPLSFDVSENTRAAAKVFEIALSAFCAVQPGVRIAEVLGFISDNKMVGRINTENADGETIRYDPWKSV
jgi:hypothetical protein